MSNIKISQLPNWPGGNTTGSFIVMNDSGSSTTYKIRKENWLFPYSGNASITGSLNVTGSVLAVIPSSGKNVNLSGGSVAFADSPFQNYAALEIGNLAFGNIPSASFGNVTFSNDTLGLTANKIRLSGSVSLTGSLSITGGTQTIQGSVNGVTLSSAVITVQGNTNNRTGSFTRDDVSFETNTGSLNRSILNRTSLTFGDDNGTVFMAKQSGSFLGMANSLNVTGSVNISTVMKLANQNPLPTGTVGSLAVSGSGLYFHNGTSWNLIS